MKMLPETAKGLNERWDQKVKDMQTNEKERITK